MNPVAKIMFDYLGDVIYRPNKASLNIESLPEDFREFAEGLKYFVECVGEVRAFTKALSKGDLNFKPPSSDNELASPLKALQASLRHVAWQTQQVAKGDYQQSVEFMGDFANAFNMMVSQLERQRNDLIEAKKNAEASSESKSAFLATVSHEIRTPLNAILGLSTVEMDKELPPDTHKNLEKIFSSGSNLLSIVNDILDISKIEAGSFEINPTEYVVPSLINDVVELNMVRLESKDIHFEVEIDETIPFKLYGDELRVKQVLNNLVSNAIKYTEEGRVHFKTSWRRQGTEAILAISVMDTGIGIKSEDIPKLFKEYSQLNHRPNRNIEGTGLGLSITKHLVELMRGSLTVESEFGQGSTFQVEIPQKIANEVPIGLTLADGLKNFRFEDNHRKRDKNLVRANMPYGKVLIVDDVITNLDVAKGLMLPYELTIECATSGLDAIERIKAAGQSDSHQKYDIVFMDHMMPEMDGMEATRIIREEIGTEYAKTVPIVALTANALSGNEEIFLNKGFSGYLSKPIDIKQLDMLLHKWIRNKQSEETLRQVERRKTDKHAAERISMLGSALSSSPKSSFSPALEGGLKGVDFATGLERYGSQEAYLKILHSYATNTKGILETLKSPLEISLSNYAISIHGLKGASNGILAKEVARLAEELERAASTSDLNTINMKNNAFLETTKRLIANIEEYLSKVAEESPEMAPKERRPAPESTMLNKIKDAAKRYKTSLLEDYMTEIEKYEYDTGTEIVDWIRKCLDELEYDAIAEKLEIYTLKEPKRY